MDNQANRKPVRDKQADLRRALDLSKAAKQEKAQSESPPPPVAEESMERPASSPAARARGSRNRRPVGLMMVGGHYPPQVRSALLLVTAQPENVGRSLQDLLGEAINDLCAKYNVPQPYRLDRDES